MESQIFDFLVDCICECLAEDQQQQKHINRNRTKSVCQTPQSKKSKHILVKSKSQKTIKTLRITKSRLKLKKNQDDQQLNKTFLSERKQKINQTCILCGKKPCDNRLACAHAIHEQCFNKSVYIPRCKKCQSKNFTYSAD